MATLAEHPVPRDIDPALVIDYDFYDDEIYRTAGGIPEAMVELRKAAPDVFWSTALGGYWVVQGYESIVDAAKRTDLFSSVKMGIPERPEDAQMHQSAPLNYDPPDHAALRTPLNTVFTPTQMYRRVDQIRDLAIDLIESVAPLGKADMFEAVTERMPVLIFIDLMGLDRADFKTYRTIATAGISSTDMQERIDAGREARRLVTQCIRERRAEPRDDLITYITRMEVNGQPVDDELALSYCILLFFAGLDTVANAMAFCLRYLAMDQDLQARLRREPEKIPHAMEELLRRHAVAPVQRTVMKDECWRGFNLRKGDMALLNYPAANIDERVFDHADQVDIDRERINHIAFGAGVHRCAGRHLARIEIVVLLEELLKRIGTFRLDPEGEVTMRGGAVLSIGTLPLVWDTN
ncbi:MAG: cytochrome P450 [Novosphingobium sp.]|nr:cytochrome P450 [Novosphingobium sp.]